MFLKMLEAGEMFEGLPEFSVKQMLEDMGLDGSETAQELGIGQIGRQVANAGQIPGRNGSQPNTNGNIENPEASVQPNEQTGGII
jgi:hypothetical protein